MGDRSHGLKSIRNVSHQEKECGHRTGEKGIACMGSKKKKPDEKRVQMNGRKIL